MTRHREVTTSGTMQEVVFQLSFIVAHDDSHEVVLESIKDHVKRSHFAESGLIFHEEVARHMAASFRIPSQCSLDDLELQHLLDLPRIIYDKGLPSKTKSRSKK